MRRLAAEFRHHPGPLAGTLVALTVSSLLVTATASLIGTGSTVRAPAERLSAATVVVAGTPSLRLTVGHGSSAQAQSLPLPAYRRVPDGLASRIAAVPGVARVVRDVSFPVGLELPGGGFDAGSATAPVTGHGWQSAALSPFGIISGTAPRTSRDLVIGAGLARADRLRPGDRVRLAGRDLPPFTVTGVAAARGRAAAQDTGAVQRSAVFFAVTEAAALYGHRGQADLIGVIGSRTITAAALADRIRHVLPAGYTVATGGRRGQLEDLAVAADALQLQQLATGVGINVAIVALFVVAGAVALSVGLRRRQFALLRAVGATGGQVRRSVLGELAVLGVLGGLLGYLPGAWLASRAMRAMAAHQLMPGWAQAWQSPWLLLVGAGTGVIVAVISGFVAAHRASRARPAEALRESVTERWWPHPVRIALCLAALGGGITLMTITLQARGNNQLTEALLLLLLLMLAVALLGPLLVALAELLLRRPGRIIAGVSGRLALADIAARPRRMASAVIPVALSVAMVGAVYFVNATAGHASFVQGRQRLTADAVVTAPGPGLQPAALRAVRAQAGVRDAIGLAPASVTVLEPDLNQVSAEAVSPGPLAPVLDPGVVAGTLAGFGPGDIAVSTAEAGSGGMGVHVGQLTTIYLADGTAYRARVTALYSRSLGFGDILIPAAAGHEAPAAFSQILVRDTGPAARQALTARLGRLSGRFPGLSVASRGVMNAQAQQMASQNGFINNLILAVIALLAAVSLVNTLVVATVERRGSLLLLRRVGATTRQLAAMTAAQSVVLSLVGIVAGAAAGVATLASMSRALTGSWVPYVTVRPVLAIAGTVLALTMAATLVPAAWILRAPEGQD